MSLSVNSSGISSSFDINVAYKDFLCDLGLENADTGGNIAFHGSDPIFETPHRLGACISIPIMAAAAGVAVIWKMKTGRGQDLSIDLRQAIHGINPTYKFYPSVNGYMLQMPYALSNPMKFELFETKDGRWFLPTGVYPHMLHGWCSFLGCPPDPHGIRKAIRQWNGFDLEDAASEKNLIGVVVRSKEEWLAHPQGQHLSQLPIVEIVKIGESDPIPLQFSERPLSDVKVMAATHVIAGNVMGRTLAEQGADVLHIVRPQEFEHEAIFIDPCAGLRSAWMNLKDPSVAEHAHSLLQKADVFIESYRGDSLRRLGFGPEKLAEERPGIIYASARCYSYDGPWANRGGFDMEALCATGFAMEEGSTAHPQFPPTKVMNDYIAGYIGAAGIQAALIRRATEGGSYHVRVNLARCAMWFMSLGLVDPALVGSEEHEVREPKSLTASTPYGELHRLDSPVEFSETQSCWNNPLLSVRGSCQPEWR